METKFPKLTDMKFEDGHTLIPNWSNYFHAGDSWVGVLNVLKAHRNEYSFFFYTEPFILSFSLELFVKSLANHHDTNFNAKSFSHHTLKIIKEYSKEIDLFQEILNDEYLCKLILEFEKTIDTKFGETAVQIEGEDMEKLLNLINYLRAEICKKTDLK